MAARDMLIYNSSDSLMNMEYAKESLIYDVGAV
jgi:hypothetical protein